MCLKLRQLIKQQDLAKASKGHFSLARLFCLSLCLNLLASWTGGNFLVLASEKDHLSLRAFRVAQGDEGKPFAKRTPSSFVPNDEIIIAPPQRRPWSAKIIVEDNHGIVSSMRTTLDEWQRLEEYVEQWDLASTGMYTLPSEEDKFKFISKRGLRYIDKRLSGEIKNAEKGSHWETVGRVEQALKPDTNVNVAPHLKLKFKARVLQGKAFMIIDNPYLDAYIEGKLNGRAKANIKKQIKHLGLTTEMEYRLKEEEWMTSVTHQITNSLSAKASNTEYLDGHAATGSDADRRVELLFSTSF